MPRLPLRQMGQRKPQKHFCFTESQSTPEKPQFALGYPFKLISHLVHSLIVIWKAIYYVQVSAGGSEDPSLTTVNAVCNLLLQ